MSTDTLTWRGRTRTRTITVGTRVTFRRRDLTIVYGRVAGIGSEDGAGVLDVTVVDVYGHCATVAEGDSVWCYQFVHRTP